MVRFKELGFETFKEYIEHFFETLLPSNKTYEYFVDWSKVIKVARRYNAELSLLNSLTKVSASDREKELVKLLVKYPNVVEVIPLLIAERAKDGKIDIFEPNIEKFIVFEFKQSNVNKDTTPQIIEFCIKTGIMELFDKVKDLHDYLLGVEVGKDTNTRKNRSGEIFERMCQQKIKRLIGKEFIQINNDRNFSLYPILTGKQAKGKTHDVVIYKENKPILVIECNFYNVSGSKPISIAESYVEMNRIAKQNNVSFLWITDGPAWNDMKEPLIRAMNNIDWVLNFRMLDRIERILWKR